MTLVKIPANPTTSTRVGTKAKFVDTKSKNIKQMTKMYEQFIPTLQEVIREISEKLNGADIKTWNTRKTIWLHYIYYNKFHVKTL